MKARIEIDNVDRDLLEKQLQALIKLLAENDVPDGHILWGLENMVSEMLALAEPMA